MATSPRRRMAPGEEPRETATQENAPLPANNEGMSVPEVEDTRAMSTTEMTEELEAPADPETAIFVRFVNAQHFEERRISKVDFAKAGVQDAEDVVWSVNNGFMVRKDKLMSFLNEAQYQSIILADSRLEEVEA
jgi:hypothetical protein